LECHVVRTCEIWVRAEGLGTVSTNAIGRCVADSFTFVVVLIACVSVVAIEEGRSAHEQVIQSGWDSDVKVGNCLVDMYAECGSMEDAWRVFNKMPLHDVVSWNAILVGCAMHRHMVRELLSILNRCVKKVYNQMISLLFVFCQCVVMQVWWTKGCAVMLQ
jgi:pentatricopeptide repeat protein